MLLEFETENYKSFLENASFQMLAAQKQKDLDYSLIRRKVKGKNIKGLCSSVIYGPNASGKTNIIGAMDVLRAIVLRGNINDSEEKESPNHAAYNLELIPNNSLAEARPVKFHILFLENDIKFDYLLVINLGRFIALEDDRNIVEEQLYIDDQLIFRRNESLYLGEFKNLKKYLHADLQDKFDDIKGFAATSLNPTELFLANGFKSFISQDIYSVIQKWFQNKFMVIYKADSIQYIRRFEDPQKQTIYVEKTTNEAAKEFGINSNAVGYVSTGNDSETRLYSIFPEKNGKTGAIPSDIFESYGTLRFINLFPLVLKAVKTGATLVVDEFDASIHPMALMSIINVFHNDDINRNGAQLVFNTHNPIFLNSNIFRRDEIKFVEKDDSHVSEIYSLADFGTSGENAVRKGEDYIKNYFVSKYGAIKDIDFTPIFENFMNPGKE